MTKRTAWGTESRHCARCGKVGPRVRNPNGFGYIHAYCRTQAERKRQRDVRRRDIEDAKQQFALDKERYFPEPPEYLA